MSSYTLELENDKLLNIIPFIQFCVNNQGKDIVIEVINEGHCLRFSGVYDILDIFTFNLVQLNTFNVIEHHPKYLINNIQWNYWLITSQQNFDFDFNYTWNKDKIFGCFYGRPSAPRLGIAGYLAKYYDEKSLVATKFEFADQDNRKLFDIQRLYEWDPNGLELVSTLQHNKKYYHTGYYDKGHYIKGNKELEYLYKNIFIDIVCEPTCSGIAFYPTEKIARAILCRKPFIAMCSKNYLIYLRQLGFRTFYEYWNEDYDGFDSATKYHMILKLIDNIAAKSLSEIITMFDNMQEILEHNYNLLVNQQYKKIVVEIDD